MFEKKELPGLIANEFKKLKEQFDALNLSFGSNLTRFSELDARLTSLEGTVKLMKAHHDKFTVEILNKVLLLERKLK